jgi:hypothetical protein
MAINYSLEIAKSLIYILEFSKYRAWQKEYLRPGFGIENMDMNWQVPNTL